MRSHSQNEGEISLYVIIYSVHADDIDGNFPSIYVACELSNMLQQRKFSSYCKSPWSSYGKTFIK
jgi:hypothetical protein